MTIKFGFDYILSVRLIVCPENDILDRPSVQSLGTVSVLIFLTNDYSASERGIFHTIVFRICSVDVLTKSIHRNYQIY